LAGTAKLVGFTEYGPLSNPPRKYSVESIKGTASILYATCGWEYFDSYSGTSSFDSNGVLSAGEVRTNWEIINGVNTPQGRPYTFSSAGGGNDTCTALEAVNAEFNSHALSPTNRGLIWNSSANPPNTCPTNTVFQWLTNEYTEDMAEGRAMKALQDPSSKTSTGTSQQVYRTQRAPGTFSFSFSEVNVSANFKVCPGDWKIYVKYTTSQGDGKECRKFLKVVNTKTGEFNIGDDGTFLKIGTAPFTDRDLTYTIVGVEAEAVPFCEMENVTGCGSANGSVRFWLGLGRTLGGDFAGQLNVEADSLTASTYTPSSLTLGTAQAGGVESVLDATGALRQVKAPQTLADIVVLDAASYEVRFYALDQVGAQDQVTKIYTVVGIPLATYRFENPDAASGYTTRLRITEARDSMSKITEFGYDDATATWTLSQGNGLRHESKVTTTAPNGDTVETRTVTGASGQVVSKGARTYHIYPWGQELVKDVQDPDGAALTTQYVFYSTVSNSDPNYSHLQQRINPDGSWEHYTYDSSGQVLKTLRPFLDSPPTTTNEALCRVTQNSYDTIADTDGDGLPETRTTTIERTLGQETARRYRIDWSGTVTLAGDACRRRSDVVCVNAGAAWNDPANLVTDSLRYAAGRFADYGRRVVNPDGTATLTTDLAATDGTVTSTVKTGQLNGPGDDILDGRMTVTVTSPAGQAINQTVTDIASNLILSSWAATQFDAVARPTRLDYSDGTYITRSYACCGLDSERDRFRRYTSYGYDPLGHQTSVTRSGITTLIGYDADGRTTSIARIGEDGSAIVRECDYYDLAGRLTSRSDALNRSTGIAETYDPTSGRRTRTTTNPDGGTSIEVFARDGSRLSVSGTAVAPHTFDYGVDANGFFTKDTATGVDADGLPTATEWVKSYTDFAGRPSKTVYPDGAIASSFYSAKGQLSRQVDPDGVQTLFDYNKLGERIVTAVDMNRDGIIDYNGTDRVSRTSHRCLGANGTTVQRVVSEVWETDNSDTPHTVSIVDTSADGQQSWQTVDGPNLSPSNGLTTHMQTVFGSDGARTETTTTPDGTITTQTFLDDRLLTTLVRHPSLGTVASASYAYDPHGRMQTAADTRTGTTTYTYYDDDQIHTVTTPDPDPTKSGDGYDPQITTYAYDSAGRLATTAFPDGGVVTNEYFPTGLLKKTSGARTYPQAYTYDPQGRVKTLTTWQNFAGNSGSSVTTWNYDPLRGWLGSKRYADNQGPTYTYFASGRLKTRTWARDVTTAYGYNNAGDLSSTTYSDSTPAVALSFDRRGRLLTTADASGTLTRTYHASGQLQNETYGTTGLPGVSSSNLLANLAVTRGFDSLDRLGTLSAVGYPRSAVGYSYDSASRLQTVTSGPNSANYGYLANSLLVETITFQNGSSMRLTTTKVYDNLNRLTAISNMPAASGFQPVAFSYLYNSANQRTRATREDGSHWDFGYDALGQVTSGAKKLSTGEVAVGNDYAFSFDDIGNRRTASRNASSSVALASEVYTANLLNEYTQRTIPGIVDVFGTARPDATVSVTLPAGSSTVLSTTRQGDRFYRQLVVDNSVISQFPVFTVTGVKNLVGPNGEDAVTAQTRQSFVPHTPETFEYDADGNLTQDGRWTYTWDAENRLIAVETRSDVVAQASGLPRQKLEFTYDAQGRRIQKKGSTWSGSQWSVVSDLRFLYDGWNLLAEFSVNPSTLTFTLTRSYTWGLDLSGSMQGAGGVGGLLQVSAFSPSDGAATPSSRFAAFDGNGNIIGLVDAADGSLTATYEYDPFGNVIKANGPAANAQPFGFSTKYTDSETGLNYYGLRYYNPSTGRWLSREPLGEKESDNLYCFVENHPVGRIDVLGLWSADVHRGKTKSWSMEVGFREDDAETIGYWDNGVDSDQDPFYLDEGNWSWHFNRNSESEEDSRLAHARESLAKAKKACSGTSWSENQPDLALTYLGQGLHPLQDWVAHGDFNSFAATPNMSTVPGWNLSAKYSYAHNAQTNQAGMGWSTVDDTNFDSTGPNGRPVRSVMTQVGTSSYGDPLFMAPFQKGHQRLDLTESLTKAYLKEFLDFVRSSPGGCKCKSEFLGQNP